jgi:hypothetical protein
MDLLTNINENVKEINEADAEFETSDDFKKGQRVKYKGKAFVVEVPDAKAGFVGIVPVGKEGDKDAVDLVGAKEVTISEYQILKGFAFTD